ncbi:MAG TPA: hypothetical protein VN328_06000 [Thermodesulfovibrionales bacterium]|nr:hypothetical protein [Thermodesulfovibrionales bacterium]
MNTRRLSFVVVAKILARMIEKTLTGVQNLLINLTYFGWRPSVVYLSGGRRRISL